LDTQQILKLRWKGIGCRIDDFFEEGMLTSPVSAEVHIEGDQFRSA
jgi:hypothetical protein